MSGFGFDSTTKSEEAVVGNYLTAGINENIKLKEVSFNDDSDNHYMEIVVEDADGRSVNRRYFDPSNDRFDVEKATNKFNKVCKNLATKFLGNDFEMEGAKSFKAFVGNFIKALKPHFGTGDLRVKVILNNKDFSTLPGYAPIFESMEVASGDSKLFINPEFDRVEKMKISNTSEADTEAGDPDWLS